MTTCDARGWHEGRWAWTNLTNDGSEFRCVCGDTRWLNHLGPPPATLRWSSL